MKNLLLIARSLWLLSLAALNFVKAYGLILKLVGAA
jgi:hypothetical protein